MLSEQRISLPHASLQRKKARYPRRPAYWGSGTGPIRSIGTSFPKRSCSNAIKNAADKKKISKQLERWLGEDFGAFNVELHYSKIMDRRIFCEEYLGDCIEDYKFFCFNGKPQFVYVSSDLIHDRQAKMGFFRLNGEKMQMRRDDYEDIGSIELPPFYDAMLADAAKLCKDFPFVRVDFFIANGKYYFAELTFTPGAGMMPFDPESIDAEWGELLDISELIEKYGK